MHRFSRVTLRLMSATLWAVWTKRWRVVITAGGAASRNQILMMVLTPLLTRRASIAIAMCATQFCRRELFFELNGYDENLFMGEDVDFYWRLNRMAKRQSAKALLIDEVRVLPSTRRFDQWPLWRTLVWTNPLIVLLFRRSATCWKGWYNPTLRTSSDNIDSNRTA